MDPENLRNRSADLQRVWGADANIAFITDSHEVAKILEHNGEQTSRAPPLTPTDPVSSSCDFDDTNFQYPEVPWYPNPPALDF